MSQAIKSVALCLALCIAGLECRAQSIQDYSRAQRSVLEADMARNTAKALGGPQAPAPGTLPASVAPPMDQQKLLPSGTAVARDRGIIVAGVIMLPTRSMVELEAGGETHLLIQGDKVPGTSWTVASIDQKEVILRSGQPRMTRRLIVPAGGR